MFFSLFVFSVHPVLIFYILHNPNLLRFIQKKKKEHLNNNDDILIIFNYIIVFHENDYYYLRLLEIIQKSLCGGQDVFA